MDKVTEQILFYREEKYKAFTEKLVPDTKYPILGVRVPILKEIAKESVKNGTYIEYIGKKHVYYEEFFVHGLILGYLKSDINDIFKLLKDFLPYIDNWAICDSTASNLKILKKHRQKTFGFVLENLKSVNTYTVRFAIVLSIGLFTDYEFSSLLIKELLKINRDEYYINMAISWYLSVCLVKDYQNTLPYIKEKRFNKFIHNKSISKAVESFRISQEKKDYLKSLKI